MILPFIIVSKTLLVLSFLPNLSLAAPAQNIDVQSHALDKRADKPSQGQIDSANGMFPGIDWNYSAEQGGCDSGQFAILVEATRMALEMMEFTGERLQLAFDTTGFNRYFMRHKEWYKQSVYRFAECMSNRFLKGLGVPDSFRQISHGQTMAQNRAKSRHSRPEDCILVRRTKLDGQPLRQCS
jgi:hypothetical protein